VGKAKDTDITTAIGQSGTVESTRPRLAKKPRFAGKIDFEVSETVSDEELERDTDTNASREAALRTNELLESILSFLPPRNLVVVQRVSKSWRAQIAGSPRIQKRMMLRLDETPRHTWEIGYTDSEPNDVKQMCRVDVDPTLDSSHFGLPRYTTPVMMGPHLKHDDSDSMLERSDFREDIVFLDQLHDLTFGRHISLLDTYISNPPCYEFCVTLAFKFVPAIPSLDYLEVPGISIRTGMVLTLGELLTKAMAVKTLVEWQDLTDSDMWCNDVAKDKCFHDVTVNEVIVELQNKYRCTAKLCVEEYHEFGPCSYFTMENVFIPSEEQWRKVNAAYAKSTKHVQ
jgi:hypothetical protein